MTIVTKRDAIESAMSIADDVAQDRLAPAALETAAVAECRATFGTVIGEGDPLWDLHRDVARQVLALDGVPADELSEWLAVARQRAGEPLSPLEPDQLPPEPEALPSVVLSPESADGAPEPVAEADAPADAEPVAETVTAVTPPRRADRYDPLSGWSPGGTRR